MTDYEKLKAKAADKLDREFKEILARLNLLLEIPEINALKDYDKAFIKSGIGSIKNKLVFVNADNIEMLSARKLPLEQSAR